jgi:hypothetical protein
MHNQYKINDVLQALGDEQMSTKQIVPKLKELDISPRSLTYFINEYMVNRYVEKERVPTRGRGTGSFIIKFRRITND